MVKALDAGMQGQATRTFVKCKFARFSAFELKSDLHLAVEGDCRCRCSDRDATCAAGNLVPTSRPAEANACDTKYLECI